MLNLAEYFPKTATIEIEGKQRRPAQEASLFLFGIRILQITAAKSILCSR
jgi:hypothetical protein